MRAEIAPEVRLSHSVVQGAVVAWAAADRFGHHGVNITLVHYMVLFPLAFRRRTSRIIQNAPDDCTFTAFLRKRPELIAHVRASIEPYREFTLASIALAAGAGIVTRHEGSPFAYFRPMAGSTQQVRALVADLTQPKGTAHGIRNPELTGLVRTTQRLCDWFAAQPLPELCFLLRTRP